MLNHFRVAFCAIATLGLASTPACATTATVSGTVLVAPVMTAATAFVAPAPIAAPVAPQTLDALVAQTDVAASPSDEQRCLATAVYFESRSESLEGQLAVAQVIRNRAESGRFRDSLCGVVHQPSQFSFARHAVPDNAAQWRTAVAIAAIAMAESYRDIAPDALYFHATSVSPGWGESKRVARIGHQIFYR